MALTPEQRSVLATIKQVAQQKGATPKQIKAAIETGLVESNLTNPKGGDADSAGWRQERASLYKNPTDVRAAASRFFDETAAVKNKYGRAGDLAAAVQRPAAQFRGRYQQQSDRASQLMGAGSQAQGSVGGGGASSSARTTPGVDNSQARAAAVSQFLGSKTADPLDFALQVRSLKDTPGQKVTSSAPTSAPSASSAGAGSSRALKRADAIAKQKLPYQWGGGHQAGGAAPGQPLDCSGAVSKVLGINPRVSGEFQSWGQAGDGGNSGVTVYSNSQHVLMKINGHFWGTSASNPGGGAGWIKQDQISPQYLAGFTARHSQ